MEEDDDDDDNVKSDKYIVQSSTRSPHNDGVGADGMEELLEAVDERRDGEGSPTVKERQRDATNLNLCSLYNVDVTIDDN